MFVGYSLEHSGDCYRMWDPKMGRIHISRDISWLDKMYFSKQHDHNPPDSQVGKSVLTTNEIAYVDNDDPNPETTDDTTDDSTII